MLLRQLNKLRKLGGPALTGVQQRTISTDDEVHMFERGGALVVLTNVGHKGSLERMLHLPRKMGRSEEED